MRNIFYRMGFNDQEIGELQGYGILALHGLTICLPSVALSGAHALGRCHTDRSGFDGPWTFSPTALTNDYYRLLLDEKWQFRKWKGPKQYEDKSTKSLMMVRSAALKISC